MPAARSDLGTATPAARFQGDGATPDGRPGADAQAGEPALQIAPAWRKESLCWDCRRAAGREMCVWARSMGRRPVQGWIARECILLCGREGREEVSYQVLGCPEFLPDHPWVFKRCTQCVHLEGRTGRRRFCVRTGRRMRVYSPGDRVACAHFMQRKRP